MKPVLDATAGNRHIWGKNKYPEGVIFLDKEENLRIPADVIATWDNIPFEDDYFHCIIFDPPHVFSLSSMYNRDPKASPNGAKKIPGWYGAFANKRQAVLEIHGAQKEFARLAPRMCFKWNEASMKLQNVLSLFDCWDIQLIVPAKCLRSAKTFWVKLTRKKQSLRISETK